MFHVFPSNLATSQVFDQCHPPTILKNNSDLNFVTISYHTFDLKTFSQRRGVMPEGAYIIIHAHILDVPGWVMVTHAWTHILSEHDIVF